MNQEYPDRPRLLKPAGPAVPARPPLVLSPHVPGGKPITSANETLSEHHLHIGSLAAVRWFFIILGAAGIAVGGGLVWWYWGQWLLTPPRVGLGLLLAGPMPLIAGVVYQFKVWHVRVTTEGLSWVDRKGEHHCTWDQVAAVYRTETRIGDRKHGDRITQLRLEIDDGRVLKVDHGLARYKKLCEAVQSITAERLLPRKRAELRGTGASFGKVTLSRDGIRIDGKELPWVQFWHYYIANGHVVFFPWGARDMQREAILFALDSVPNYLVLLTLLVELGKHPTPIEESVRYFYGR